MASPLRIGVIGYGYWGPNLVRNFAEVDGAEVRGVADARDARLALVRRRYPAISVTTDAARLINDREIDAVVVATPVSSHYALVRAALQAGKHVLVEKPLAGSAAESQELVALAKAKRLTLMVDHTFIYTSAVQKLKELTTHGIGEAYYFDSVRTNLGLFQSDVNVIWDLAPHDLSILLFLFGRMPTAVSAIGASHVNALEDTAYINLLFDDQFIAHIHVSWLAPVKIRRIVLSGSQQMIVYDDVETSEKVRIYDKGVSVVPASQDDIYRMLVQYRMGDMHSPSIEHVEALQTESRHFIDCVRRGTAPTTSGAFGLQIVRLLEAADASMKAGGAVQRFAAARRAPTSPRRRQRVAA